MAKTAYKNPSPLDIYSFMGCTEWMSMLTLSALTLYKYSIIYRYMLYYVVDYYLFSVKYVITKNNPASKYWFIVNYEKIYENIGISFIV